MNLNKHIEFFNPDVIKKEEVNIIGVGAVGSWIALSLVKLGVTNLTIWDYDTIDDHNVTNQVYDSTDIGMSKVDALEKHLVAVNPELKIIKRGKYEGEEISGVCFLEVDKMEVRRTFADANEFNTSLKLVIDGRIGLSDGEVTVVPWDKEEWIDSYIEMVNSFNDEDAHVQLSACGTTLSVIPSVLVTASYAVSSLISWVNNERKVVKSRIVFDAFDFTTRAR